MDAAILLDPINYPSHKCHCNLISLSDSDSGSNSNSSCGRTSCTRPRDPMLFSRRLFKPTAHPELSSFPLFCSRRKIHLKPLYALQTLILRFARRAFSQFHRLLLHYFGLINRSGSSRESVTRGWISPAICSFFPSLIGIANFGTWFDRIFLFVVRYTVGKLMATCILRDIWFLYQDFGLSDPRSNIIEEWCEEQCCFFFFLDFIFRRSLRNVLA